MAKDITIKQSLIDRIKSVGTIKEMDVLSQSKIFDSKECIPTTIPMFNVALSGDLDGGFTPGLTMIAGPSRHFKTLFTLLMAKAYLDKYPDAILIFYDSEFGAPLSYFDSLGINKDRVIHIPVLDIEQLKFDVVAQLNNLNRGDHVIVLIDSVGNLASIKEVTDAEDQKSVTDMSRSKSLKSFFRIVSPRATLKHIPVLVVNHTYKTLEIYSKDVVSGGTGAVYNSDTIFIIGRQQDVDGAGASKTLTGYNYVINVEKSRFVKEKSKILIEVTFAEGISHWSGLLQNAIESGFIEKLPRGYAYKNEKYKEEDMNTEEFWKPILADETFKTFIRDKYQLAQNGLL